MAQAFAQKCNLCNEKEGVHFCYECRHALCELCRVLHDKFPSMKGHEITKLQNVDLANFTTIYCCENHQREFEFYCETCDCLTCSQCVISTHEGHKFSGIKILVSVKREDVNELLTELKAKVKSIADLKERLQFTCLEKLRTDACDAVKAVGETFQDLLNFIEHKKKIRKTEIEDYEKIERQELESFLQQVNNIMLQYSRKCSEMENLLLEKHDVTFYKRYKALKNDLENFENVPEEPIVNEVPVFEAIVDYKEISDFINSKAEKSLCSKCNEQERLIDDLTAKSKEYKETIESKMKEKEDYIKEWKVKELEFVIQLKHTETRLNEETDAREKIEAVLKETEKKLKAVQNQKKINYKVTKVTKLTEEKEGDAGSTQDILKTLFKKTNPELRTKKAVLKEESSSSGKSSLKNSSPTQEMTFQTSEGIIVKVYEGNILLLNVDCIVNAANETLNHGGGVADVISRAAGYGFQQESDKHVRMHGSLKVTQCCTTSAGNLQFNCVIHAVGPRWYDYRDKKACADDLRMTVENCFYEAETQNISTVALPTISSGIFGVPKEICCSEYCKAVKEYSNKCGKTTCLKEIHFIDKESNMIMMIQKEFGQNLT